MAGVATGEIPEWLLVSSSATESDWPLIWGSAIKWEGGAVKKITDMGSVLKLYWSEPYWLKPKTKSISARSGFQIGNGKGTQLCNPKGTHVPLAHRPVQACSTRLVSDSQDSVAVLQSLPRQYWKTKVKWRYLWMLAKTKIHAILRKVEKTWNPTRRKVYNFLQLCWVSCFVN